MFFSSRANETNLCSEERRPWRLLLRGSEEHHLSDYSSYSSCPCYVFHAKS